MDKEVLRSEMFIRRSHPNGGRQGRKTRQFLMINFFKVSAGIGCITHFP